MDTVLPLSVSRSLADILLPNVMARHDAEESPAAETVTKTTLDKTHLKSAARALLVCFITK